MNEPHVFHLTRTQNELHDTECEIWIAKYSHISDDVLDREGLLKPCDGLFKSFLVGFLDFWKAQVRSCCKTMYSPWYDMFEDSSEGQHDRRLTLVILEFIVNELCGAFAFSKYCLDPHAKRFAESKIVCQARL